MSTTRRLASIAGVLYLVTFVTSIPALLLKEPALADPLLADAGLSLGSGVEAGVRLAGFLEVVLAVACVGTAVALYPIVRRRSEAAAVGFVAARVLEASLIGVGVIAMLSVVTVHEPLGGGSEPNVLAMSATVTALIALHDWTFLLGPGLVPAVNAVLLGAVLYRTGLVPRAIPAMGLLGAPLLAASATATLFGVHDQVSVTAALLAAPIALWELSLGVWLVAKGFRPAAIERLEVDRETA